MAKKKIQALVAQMATHDNFGQFRFIKTDDGEIYFVAKDICKILGYTNSRKAIADHVDLEDRKVFKSNETVLLKIPNRGLTFINESGLYSLIFGSQLPTAKKFKRWVTSEVLPAIRKLWKLSNVFLRGGFYYEQKTVGKNVDGNFRA